MTSGLYFWCWGYKSLFCIQPFTLVVNQAGVLLKDPIRFLKKKFTINGLNHAVYILGLCINVLPENLLALSLIIINRLVDAES